MSIPDGKKPPIYVEKKIREKNRSGREDYQSLLVDSFAGSLCNRECTTYRVEERSQEVIFTYLH